MNNSCHLQLVFYCVLATMYYVDVDILALAGIGLARIGLFLYKVD